MFTILDDELAKVTKELNAILDRVQKSSTERDRELAFLATSHGLVLAWVRHDTTSQHDEDEDIERALGLK